MISIYFAAIATGFAGSLHCLGMCGPLMAGIGAGHERWSTLHRQMLLHHLGRINGYMLFGMVFGAFGQLAMLVTVQRWLMVMAGAIILLTLLYTARPVSGQKFSQWVSRLFKMTGVRAGSNTGMYMLGLANGFLPCGLVYAAAAGAMASGSWYGGMLFMGLFGLANTPVLWLSASWKKLVPARLHLRNKLWRTIPLAIIAVFFILKGAGLGIPYVSPAFGSENHKPACCKPGNR
jgi:uncharacterized protein